MKKTHAIDIPTVWDFPRMLEVWEASVRATHDFVKEEQIVLLKKIIVEKELFQHSNLICVRDESGKVEGFAGTTADSLDMLFIHPEAMKSGIGKALMLHAINVLGVKKVDVNEENVHARSFYEHFGFKIVDRSATDEYELPFPILHMYRHSG